MRSSAENSQIVRNVRGAVAIEFALAAPLLLLLLAGLVEIGLATLQIIQVQNSVEAGVLFAAQNGWDSFGISNAVSSATTLGGVTATPAPQQFCGCPGPTGVAQRNCKTLCADGNPPGSYVTISASATRLSLFPQFGFGIPITLTRQATVRLQ